MSRSLTQYCKIRKKVAGHRISENSQWLQSQAHNLAVFFK